MGKLRDWLWNDGRARGAARYVSLAFVGIGIAGSKLNRTAGGTLIALLVLYAALPVLSGIEPMSASELLLWMDAQETSVKTSIVAALLTIVGFMAAFGTAVRSWKGQRRTELRLAAGDEIHEFFSQAGADLLELQLFAGHLAELYARLIGPDPDVSEPEGFRLIERAKLVHSARLRLSKAVVSVHGLKAKHELVLIDQPLGIFAFEKAQTALERAVDLMWYLTPLNASSPGAAFAFVQMTDPTGWNKFVAVSDQTLKFGPGAASAIRAAAISDVMSPKWSSLFRLWKTSKIFMLIPDNEPATDPPPTHRPVEHAD